MDKKKGRPVANGIIAQWAKHVLTFAGQPMTAERARIFLAMSENRFVRANHPDPNTARSMTSAETAIMAICESSLDQVQIERVLIVNALQSGLEIPVDIFDELPEATKDIVLELEAEEAKKLGLG